MRPQDADLVPMLSHSRGFQRVILAATLGDAEGKTGPPALRSLLSESGPGTSDLKCAALLALAKRCGEQANGDYVAAFHDKDSGTRDYALIALAAFGADGLWNEVTDRLAKTLARRNRRPSHPSKVILMATYLARHADSRPQGVEKLAGLLRRRWDRLDEEEERPWLLRFWPELSSSDSATNAISLPDSQAMQRWIRDHPLLGPVAS